MAQYICCYVPCTYLVPYNSQTQFQPVPLQNQSQLVPVGVNDGNMQFVPPSMNACGNTVPPPASAPTTPVSTFHVHNPYSLNCIDEYSSTASAATSEVTDDCSNITDDDFDDAPSERSRNKQRRRKRKAAIDDDNNALDALRYKTKMCKNWEVTGKCPYGPRCLFAHGKRELRSYTENNQAIMTAAQSDSPERQFFSIGRFPSFIPVPKELMDLASCTA